MPAAATAVVPPVADRLVPDPDAPEAGRGDAMLLDRLMPRWDATRREHLVVDGDLATVHAAVLRADFLRAATDSRAVRALFAVRSGAERVAARAGRRPFSEPPAPDALRLADMTTHGEWVRLGDDPPREIAFGAVGRFWGGRTAWEEIDAAQFAGFARPGLARIACNISLRPYGDGRTLVSYEARTAATDAAGRRAFRRYWRVVSPGVGIVMRSLLRVVAREAGRGG
jgi:hypothetical protein